VEELSNFTYLVFAGIALFRLCVFRSVCNFYYMFWRKKTICEFFKK